MGMGRGCWEWLQDSVDSDRGRGGGVSNDSVTMIFLLILMFVCLFFVVIFFSLGIVADQSTVVAMIS